MPTMLIEMLLMNSEEPLVQALIIAFLSMVVFPSRRRLLFCLEK